MLANLAVMELQFMHCCALDWRKRASDVGAAAGTGASDFQVLNSADDDDDDDDAGGGDRGEGEASCGSEVFDWSTIDISISDIFNAVSWQNLDYPDEAEPALRTTPGLQSLLPGTCSALPFPPPQLSSSPPIQIAGTLSTAAGTPADICCTESLIFSQSFKS
jgi:hypothetical protein